MTDFRYSVLDIGPTLQPPDMETCVIYMLIRMSFSFPIKCKCLERSMSSLDKNPRWPPLQYLLNHLDGRNFSIIRHRIIFQAV